MMEASPASPFKVSQTEFALQFLVVALDAPAQLDEVDEVFESYVFRQGGEPVFCRRRLALGPFDDQPFDRMRRR